jgi:hypothetical protein
VKLSYSAKPSELDTAFKMMYNPIAVAATGAVREVAAQGLTAGRGRIAAAGFSKRWTDALRVTVYPMTGVSAHAAAVFRHKIPYAGVFETGAVLSGKPLMWVPLGNAPNRVGGRRLTPRNYVQQVGPLHSINVPGKPPMLAAYAQAGRFTAGRKISITKLRAGAALARLGVRARRSDTGRAGVISVPIFVGLTQVRLQAVFGLEQVFQSAQAALEPAYRKNLPSWVR